MRDQSFRGKSPNMPASYARDLKKLLTEHGWEFHRQAKGSHEIWIGPEGNKVSLPSNCKRRQTANAILKQAGIDAKL